MTYQTPPTLDGTTEQKVNQLRSYLFQLAEALNVSQDQPVSQALSAVTASTVRGSASGTTGEYSALKALIIKNAEQFTVTTGDLYTKYEAVSDDFGTYSLEIENMKDVQADQDGRISALGTKVTETLESLGEVKQTVVSAQSEIKQNSTEIEATVAELAAYKASNDNALSGYLSRLSTVEQKSDSITATVTAMGSEMETVQGQLALKIDRDENDQIVSMLNAAADLISLTGNRIKIKSDYFELTETGEITAAKGTIGGLTLADNTLTATYTKTYPTFTDADITKAQSYIVGTGTLTDAEFEAYDINMDGRVTGLDVLGMQKMMEGLAENYSVYQFTIDPSNCNACVTVEVVEGYHVGWKTTIGMGGVSARNMSVSDHLNVAGSLTLRDSSVADFIVEYGEEEGWHYEKWYSGKAECWGKFNLGTLAVTTAWGSLFETQEQSVDFPAKLFVEAPDYLSVEFLSSDSGAAIIERGVGLSATSTGAFWLVRATALSAIDNATVGLRAIGRWK